MRAGGLLALAVLLSAAPALGADHKITAGPTPLTYATTDVSIDQGDTITFENDDSSGVGHDVIADKDGPNGSPLFSSDLIGKGKTAPVNGVQFLTTGDYGYHCSVHSFMTGTIHVSANGTALPPDRTPPDATVTIADSRIRTVLKHNALKVILTSNEDARFKLAATSGKTTIAKGTLTLKGSTKRTGAITLTKAGKKLLASVKSLTVKLKASVNDVYDNRAAAAATRRLR